MAKLLDLFCGAGGAAMGYYRAGFDEIVGVDINPQPRYPFEFVQSDVFDFLNAASDPDQCPGHIGGYCLNEFDVVHASPPCQDYSRAVRHLSSPGYPRLIEPTQDILETLGCPYVIENVVGSPIPIQSTLFGRHGFCLCGTMFGLRIWRHRLFATNFAVALPGPCNHAEPAMNPFNSAGAARLHEECLAVLGHKDVGEAYWRDHWGVGWMNRSEGREAIPPAYPEYIGQTLIQNLEQGE